jgi:uncharacterized protein
MSDRSPLVTGLSIASVAFVIGSFVVAASLKDVRRADEVVSVTGSAKRSIRSDFVVWNLSVTAQASSLPPASQELQRYADQVMAFLREQQIPDSAVTSHPIETSAMTEVTESGRETGRVAGYRLTKSFEVRSADVDGMTRISQRTGDLINRGVPLVASQPQYLFTKLGELRPALLADATKEARTRADVIAQSTGVSVGKVRSARIGVFQITPRFSTEVADYGINDVSSVEKDVTAVVHVTFSLR